MHLIHVQFIVSSFNTWWDVFLLEKFNMFATQHLSRVNTKIFFIGALFEKVCVMFGYT